MIAMKELEARRGRLVDELEKLDNVIGSFKAYASVYAPDMLGGDASLASPTAKVASPPWSRPRFIAMKAPAGSPTITERTADAAWEAIVEANAPLSLADIEKAVVAAGVPLGETDNPRNVIGARLYNSKRFVSTSAGWWLKDEPLPDMLKSEPTGSHENEALNGKAASASEARSDANPS